jgi:hypothetical protein
MQCFCTNVLLCWTSKWTYLINTRRKLRVPYRAKISWSTEPLVTSQEDSDPLLSDRSHDTCRVAAWTCLQNVISKCIHENHKHCSWHFATVIAKEMCLRGKSYRVHDASPEKLYSGRRSLTSAYSTPRTDCSTDMKINVHYSQVAHRFRSPLVLTWPARSEMNTKPLFLTRCHLYKLASRNQELYINFYNVSWTSVSSAFVTHHFSTHT